MNDEQSVPPKDERTLTEPLQLQPPATNGCALAAARWTVQILACACSRARVCGARHALSTDHAACACAALCPAEALGSVERQMTTRRMSHLQQLDDLTHITEEMEGMAEGCSKLFRQY
eukprot:1248923-Prymnesium_polylepis.1